MNIHETKFWLITFKTSWPSSDIHFFSFISRIISSSELFANFDLVWAARKRFISEDFWAHCFFNFMICNFDFWSCKFTCGHFRQKSFWSCELHSDVFSMGMCSINSSKWLGDQQFCVLQASLLSVGSSRPLRLANSCWFSLDGSHSSKYSISLCEIVKNTEKYMENLNQFKCLVIKSHSNNSRWWKYSWQSIWHQSDSPSNFFYGAFSKMRFADMKLRYVVVILLITFNRIDPCLFSIWFIWYTKKQRIISLV